MTVFFDSFCLACAIFSLTIYVCASMVRVYMCSSSDEESVADEGGGGGVLEAARREAGGER